MYEILCHNGSYLLFWKDKITKFLKFPTDNFYYFKIRAPSFKRCSPLKF